MSYKQAHAWVCSAKLKHSMTSLTPLQQIMYAMPKQSHFKQSRFLPWRHNNAAEYLESSTFHAQQFELTHSSLYGQFKLFKGSLAGSVEIASARTCIMKSSLYARTAKRLIKGHEVKGNWHPFTDGGEKSRCQRHEYSKQSLEGTRSPSPSLLSVLFAAVKSFSESLQSLHCPYAGARLWCSSCCFSTLFPPLAVHLNCTGE